jgi:hypothetical protein
LNVNALKKYLTIAALFMAGCSANTVTTAVKEGATALNAEEIYQLVTNNTMQLVASNFDAHIYYAKNGSFAAKALNNSDDIGKWDIKSDSSLCLKFRVWYYGDLNCYSVYQNTENSNYLLFSSNGALAYTANIKTGDTKQLAVKSRPETKATYLRSSLGKGQNNASVRSVTEDSSIEKATPFFMEEPENTTERENDEPGVKDMAKECPGCNLAGADLRQANLVRANLKDANLKGARLNGANLRRANLEGANLTGAKLLSANLPGANLKNADLSGADLTGSNLIHADLRGANLTNTILLNTLQEDTKGL